MLVVGAEKLSQYVHPEDRSISFLLGDGAGAAIVGPADEPGISASVWGSDGSKWDAVGMNATFEEYLDKKKPWPTMRQDGQTVFRWAVWEMAKVGKQALDAAGVTADDLAAFIPHQANMRIIDELAKQLKLPEHVQDRPRHRDHRQHLGRLDPARHATACCRRTPSSAAASPCRSASARGWSTGPRWYGSPRIDHGQSTPTSPRKEKHNGTHSG